MEEVIREPGKRVPLGTRIVAFMLDYLIILCYIILLVGVFFLARSFLTPLFTGSPASAEFTGFLFITFPVYLYFAVCEGSKFHATWGKRKMGIIVTGRNGQPIGPGASFFRSFLKFIPWELAHFTIWHMVLPSGYPDGLIYSLLTAVYALSLIYLVSPLLNKKKQTLYDMIAGTVVRYRE